jgi:hypothetical protein
MKYTWQKLSKQYAKVTPTNGKLLILARILESFWTLQSCWEWENRIVINSEDETSYMTQYQKAVLRYVENENNSNHQRLPVIKPESVLNNNLVFLTIASTSDQSSYDP